ncbi:MAG: transposase [Patescibacteria group bacterium]
MRGVEFINNEYYHIYNRGVDKRTIFADKSDLDRFYQSMDEFNTEEPIGSIYANSFRKNPLRSLAPKKQKKIVDFICYCLNPNHYHFILSPLVDKGIEKFMHKIGGGYTNYFNEKHKRTGSLFQGTFKAIHIDSNEYLLHLSAYINLNNKAHSLGSEAPKSSWKEYITDSKENFCNKKIILGQFKNSSEYKKFAEDSLVDIKQRKDMEKLLLE